MSRKHKILLGIGIGVIFSLFLLIIFGNNAMLESNRLKKERDNIIERNKELALNNNSMYNEIKRLKDDPEYIENVARRELGMIKKNEIILQFKDKKEVAIEK
ncbi:MAG: septum formation initiator family protein [Pseudomonadota bacterium]